MFIIALFIMSQTRDNPVAHKLVNTIQIQWNTSQHSMTKSQKHYAVKDTIFKRLHTILLHLYESLKKTQLIHGGSLKNEVGV